MRQLPFSLPAAENYAEEDFLVADSNRPAWDWIMRWPDWPENASILSGPSESGKTHLASIWARKSDAGLINAEDWPNTPPDALFGERMALVIEDIERLADFSVLFHLLNYLKQQPGRWLLMTVIDSACWGTFTLPDLRSRLQALPQVALAMPDETLIAALLVKGFQDRQLRVGEGVVPYLVTRIERSYAAAASWVARLDQEALARRKPITIALARELLTENLPFTF